MKAAFRFALWLAQAHRLARWRNRNAVAVLMYHGVTPAGNRPARGDRVAADEFERQVRYLTTHYDVRTVEEWLSGAQPERGRPGAALTFDDGLASVCVRALPILARYGCPATVYLCPGLIDRGELPWFETLHTLMPDAGTYETEAARLKHLPPDEQRQRLAELAQQSPPSDTKPKEDSRLMTWEEIERAAEGGQLRFGAHTLDHTILSGLSIEAQRAQIAASRDRIVAHTGACETFAYPNGQAGDFTEDTVRLVREAGFRGAVTAMAGLARPDDDPYRWPRLAVGPGMTDAHFALRTAGLFGEQGHGDN